MAFVQGSAITTVSGVIRGMAASDETTPLNENFENIPTLPLTISGVDSPSVHTLLFVHGYPDDESIFQQQVTHFSCTYRVACVRLPWFSTYERAERDAERYGHNRTGYTVPELAEALANATDSLCATLVTVIGHDWGAIIAQLTDIKYPGLFHSMVALDVALPRWIVTRKLNLPKDVGFVLYAALYMVQVTLFYVMFTRNIFPQTARCGINAVVRFITKYAFWNRPGVRDALRCVSGSYPSRCTSTGNTTTTITADTHPLSGYPYYDFLRVFLACLFRRQHQYWVSPEEQPEIWSDFPSCPVLYMYGKSAKAGFLFHDKEWENEIRERIDGSAAVCYEDGGHWFFVENATQCNIAIEQWLDKLLLNGFV